MTSSWVDAKPTTPTRPPWANRPSAATWVTTLLANDFNVVKSVALMLPDSSRTRTRSVGVDWTLVSPWSVRVTVEVPPGLMDVGVADAPGVGAAEADGAPARPVAARARVAARAMRERFKAGVRLRP